MKTLATLQEMKGLTVGLIKVFASQIKLLSLFISDAYETLEQNKENREKLVDELRELLTKKKSMRRKDFDLLIKETFAAYLTKERFIKESVHPFLIHQLDLIERMEDTLSVNALQGIHALNSQILGKIDQFQEKFAQFQQVHEKQTQQLEFLSKRGEQLTVVEFKKGLEEIHGIHEECFLSVA